MLNGSVFLQYYVEQIDKNSPFQSICGNQYQNSVFLKTTTHICLRSAATLTSLLDRVIFDIIDDYEEGNQIFYTQIKSSQ